MASRCRSTSRLSSSPSPIPPRSVDSSTRNNSVRANSVQPARKYAAAQIGCVKVSAQHLFGELTNGALFLQTG